MALRIQKLLDLCLEQNASVCIFKNVHFLFWLENHQVETNGLLGPVTFHEDSILWPEENKRLKTTYLHVELLKLLEVQPPAGTVLEETFVPLLELVLIKLCALHQVLHHFGGQFAILFPHSA